MACLVCGSARLRPLYEGVRDHHGIATDAYRFLGCEACGSATLDPLPSADALASFYPPGYTFKPANGAGAPLRRIVGALEWHAFYAPICRGRLRALRRLTGLRAGRVLEVGCGSGFFLRYLAAAGYEVEGLELSEVDAEYARTCLAIPVAHGSLETSVLERERYDGIVLLHVLEHLPDPAGALRRLFGALRRGGWLVLGLPLVDSAQAKLLGARWYAVTEAPRHVMLPSLIGIRRLLEDTGFRDVRAAPAPLTENAGQIALSLLPGAATPLAYGRSRPLERLVRRSAAALLVLPALLLAWAERARWTGGAPAGSTIVCGRK